MLKLNFSYVSWLLRFIKRRSSWRNLLLDDGVDAHKTLSWYFVYSSKIYFFVFCLFRYLFFTFESRFKLLLIFPNQSTRKIREHKTCMFSLFFVVKFNFTQILQLEASVTVREVVGWKQNILLFLYVEFKVESLSTEDVFLTRERENDCRSKSFATKSVVKTDQNRYVPKVPRRFS